MESKFSKEQITYALRNANGGKPAADVRRRLMESKAAFYSRKKKYGTVVIAAETTVLGSDAIHGAHADA